MSKRADRYSKRGVQTSYVSTVIGVSLVLFVIAIVLGGTFALENIQKNAKESLTADIFFKPEYTDADIKQVEMEIRTWPYFKEVRYIDSEHALEEIQGFEQNADEITSLFDGEIAVPTNISYHPKEAYADVEGMKEIKNKLLETYAEEIDEVHYNEASIDSVNLGFKQFVYLFGVVALLLIVVAVAMINNTIRLALYSQRFTIKTMQLVGATGRFIRRPFLWKSILQGIISAIIGLGLFMLLLYVLDTLFKVIDFSLPLPLLLILYGSIVLLGILICYMSTLVALNKYLRMKVDDLY